MTVPEVMAEAIYKSNQALAETLASAFSNLKYQRAPTIKLTKFRGAPSKTGDPTLKEWLDDLDTYAGQLSLTDKEKVSATVDHLAGSAREEVLCCPLKDRDEFSKLRELLRLRFGSPETVQSLNHAFYSREQLEGESLTDFSRSIMRLYDRMEAMATDSKEKAALNQLREGALKEQFVRGVSDPSVRRELRRLVVDHPESTFFELRNLALRLFQDVDRLPHYKSPTSDPVCSIEQTDSMINRASCGDLATTKALGDLVESQKGLATTIDKLVQQQGALMQQQAAVLQQLTANNACLQRLANSLEKGQGGSSKPHVVCSFCKKVGHNIDSCFKRKNMLERKGKQPSVEPKPTHNVESGNVVPPT